MNINNEKIENDNYKGYRSLINILNYSDNNNTKIKSEKKNKNILLSGKKANNNSHNEIKIQKDNTIKFKNKRIKDIFKNKIKKKSTSNKSIRNYNKKSKINVIAKNQIERSLRHFGLYSNDINNNDIFAKNNGQCYSCNSHNKI